MQKYHQTLTEAWVLAVNHFTINTDGYQSADDFIESNTVMLDSKIMMTHYSAEILFSDEARKAFVEPNLETIPRHTEKQAVATVHVVVSKSVGNRRLSDRGAGLTMQLLNHYSSTICLVLKSCRISNMAYT